MILNIQFVLIILGGVALVVLYLLKFGYAAQILSNLIGVIYPGYVSFKAVESNTKLNDKKWVTYWIIYGVLFIVEYFLVALTNVIPFYWFFKGIFLMWCMFPIDNNGSVIIYHLIIEPYMMKLGRPSDQVLDKPVRNDLIIGDNLATEDTSDGVKTEYNSEGIAF